MSINNTELCCTRVQLVTSYMVQEQPQKMLVTAGCQNAAKDLCNTFILCSIILHVLYGGREFLEL